MNWKNLSHPQHQDYLASRRLWYANNLKERQAYYKMWYAKNANKDSDRSRKNRPQRNARRRRFRVTNGGEQRLMDKQRYKEARNKVIQGYGSKCACCGETLWEFLTVDHVNGKPTGGHKRDYGLTLYLRLIRENFPPDCQCLCWNCNCSKGFYGECPHKRPKAN